MSQPALPRLAAIDVGTNTSLLLVADFTPEGRLLPIVQNQRFVRLGKGVDAEKRVNEDALKRLIDALRDQKAIAEAHHAAHYVVGATSASRDARNRQEIIDRVRQEVGLEYEIIGGEEEAEWTFLGALSGFEDGGNSCVVIDIGGGSTEIIVGNPSEKDPAQAIRYRRSFDIGTVRLTERLFSSQPPAAAEVDAALDTIHRTLDLGKMPDVRGLPVVAAAGTASSLGMVHTGAATHEVLDENPPLLGRADVRAWRDRLLGMTYEEVLALYPDVLLGRADVFPTGILILDTILEMLDASGLRLSVRGLRHGLALRYLHGLRSAAV